MTPIYHLAVLEVTRPHGYPWAELKVSVGLGYFLEAPGRIPFLTSFSFHSLTSFLWLVAFFLQLQSQQQGVRPSHPASLWPFVHSHSSLALTSVWPGSLFLETHRNRLDPPGWPKVLFPCQGPYTLNHIYKVPLVTWDGTFTGGGH